MGLFNSRSSQYDQNHRLWISSKPRKSRGSPNKVRTLNFDLTTSVIVIFFEQVFNLPCLYFFLIGLLQTIPQFTVTRGFPAMWVPLSQLILISLFIEILSVIYRRRISKEENEKIVQTVQSVEDKLTIQEVKRRKLKYGHLVFLKNKEVVPADILILKSSSHDSSVYTDNSCIDGEGSYKYQRAPKELDNIDILGLLETNSLEGYVSLGPPDADITHFLGHCRFEIAPEKEPIEFLRTSENTLLRGSKIIRTSWVLGIVLYTGRKTKAFQRIPPLLPKTSLLEKKTGQMLRISFYILIWTSFFFSILPLIIEYASFRKIIIIANDGSNTLLFRFITWMLMIINIVPISLFFFLKIAKYFQAMIMQNDSNLETMGQRLTVFNSNLNSDLGQVKFMFVDKTGTLTNNYMNVMAVSIGGQQFPNEHSSAGVIDYPHVFLDSSTLKDVISSNDLSVWEFFIHVCSNTTTAPLKGSQKTPVFLGSNFDELALQYFATYYGFTYINKQDSYVELKLPNENLLKIEIWAQLGFTSTRKKSSVVVRYFCPLLNKERIAFFSKGPMYAMHQCTGIHKASTLRDAETYGNQMMRVMCFASRELSEEAFSEWFFNFKEARLSSNLQAMEKLMQDLESELSVQGCIGFQSDINEDADKTVALLKNAGIYVIMVTGDDFDVSIQTAKKTHIFENADDLSIIQIDNPAFAFEQLQLIFANISTESSNISLSNFCMAIDGNSLHNVMCINPVLVCNLITLLGGFIVCRATPLHKEFFVSIINKMYMNHIVTLAVGDGLNDCAMLQAASVSIGIRNDICDFAFARSDYGLSQFKHVAPLLLVHGRWNYRRLAILTQYSLSRVFIIDVPQLVNSSFNLFKPQKVIGTGVNQFFNPLYSSLGPIIFAIWDCDLPGDVVMKHPEVYKSGIKNRIFNLKLYGKDLFFATIQGIIAGLIPILIIGYNFVDSSGRPISSWTSSTTSFFCALFLMSQKLNFECTSTTSIILLVNTLSAATFFPTIFAFRNLRDTAYQMVTSPYFYVAWFLTFFLGILQEYVRQAYKRLRKPGLVEKLQQEITAAKPVESPNFYNSEII